MTYFVFLKLMISRTQRQLIMLRQTVIERDLPECPVLQFVFLHFFYSALNFTHSPAAEESQERRRAALKDGHDCLLDVCEFFATSVYLTSEHAFK